MQDLVNQGRDPNVVTSAPANAQMPFFVVGAQRSGTTLLRLMLNSHPRLAVPFESGFIPVFYRRLGEYGSIEDPRQRRRLLEDIAQYPKVMKGDLLPDPSALAARDLKDYPSLIAAVFQEYAARQGKPRWGDKTPFYITELDVLWTLFPGCRIVHLVRDGRDVAVSLRGIGWGSSHIPRVAQSWRWKTMLAHKIGAVLGDSFLEVRYEDLVRDAEPVLRRVCAFLGEEYAPAMLEYHRHAERDMPTDSMQWHRSSVSRPDPGKVFAWRSKMSPADQVIFEEVAGDALDAFGYERCRRRPGLATALKRVYYCAIRRW